MQERSHSHRHILDVVISREDDTFVKEVLMTSMPSDHYLVDIEVSLNKPPVSTKSVPYYKYKLIDKDVFLEDTVNACGLDLACLFTMKCFSWLDCALDTSLPLRCSQYHNRKIKECRVDEKTAFSLVNKVCTKINQLANRYWLCQFLP